MERSNGRKVEQKEKKGLLKKFKLIVEWEDKELFKLWQEKTRLQDQTLLYNLHISDAKWILIRKKIQHVDKRKEIHPKSSKQIRCPNIK